MPDAINTLLQALANHHDHEGRLAHIGGDKEAGDHHLRVVDLLGDVIGERLALETLYQRREATQIEAA